MVIAGKATDKQIREMERFGIAVKVISVGTFRSINIHTNIDPHDPDGGLDVFRNEQYVAIDFNGVGAYEGVKRILDVRNQDVI